MFARARRCVREVIATRRASVRRTVNEEVDARGISERACLGRGQTAHLAFCLRACACAYYVVSVSWESLVKVESESVENRVNRYSHAAPRSARAVREPILRARHSSPSAPLFLFPDSCLSFFSHFSPNAMPPCVYPPKLVPSRKRA